MMSRNILLFVAAIIFCVGTASAGTLDQVRKREVLICGANPGLAGFSMPDDKGNWTGFDIDFCRAIAAAIFDNLNKIQILPVPAKDRFAALQSSDIDVLTRNTTWTLSREAGQGSLFAGITYFDGQGFMTRTDKKITSTSGLASTSICVQQGTASELNLADFFKATNMPYQPVLFATMEAAIAAYDGGQCDAITTDISSLHAARTILTHPGDHIVLPEAISKEPLGPAVRQGDDQWLNIVKWVNFAMIDAEEAGITSANVDEMAKSDIPEIRRLLGLEGNFGEGLGLTPDWAYRIIKRIGNYGEVFDRNLGDGSKLHIKRGLNALWFHGGLHYGPPMR